MRTTLNIDDEVLAAARSLAERNDSSLGAALSELARRGFKGAVIASDADAVVFRVPTDAQPFTSNDVSSWLSDWP
ncbi:MAG: antitoxin [Chloroflexi bacterium]|nr:antitoxin [Chloroflexota bacterium]